MWVSILDYPIDTRGKNGKTFLLWLSYKNYYGHNLLRNGEVVKAVWNATDECFYEVNTMKEIDNSEIVQWWKEAE